MAYPKSHNVMAYVPLCLNVYPCPHTRMLYKITKTIMYPIIIVQLALKGLLSFLCSEYFFFCFILKEAPLYSTKPTLFMYGSTYGSNTNKSDYLIFDVFLTAAR